MKKSQRELIEKLRSDPMYKKSLGMAENDEQRKKIEAIVEGFVSRFASAVIPVLAAQEAKRSEVVPTSVVTSGSAG